MSSRNNHVIRISKHCVECPGLPSPRLSAAGFLQASLALLRYLLGCPLFPMCTNTPRPSPQRQLLPDSCLLRLSTWRGGLLSASVKVFLQIFNSLLVKALAVSGLPCSETGWPRSNIPKNASQGPWACKLQESKTIF